MGLRHYRYTASALISVPVLMVGACSVSDAVVPAPAANDDVMTISAREFEETTEQRVLEKGFDVAIDCGSDDVPLIVGTSVNCVARYRGDDSVSRLTVTISRVAGGDFDVSVIGLGRPAG